MKDKSESKTGRRSFLSGTATGTLLVAAAVAAGAPKAWAKPETKEERKKARYKESEHVKRFYQSNRY